MSSILPNRLKELREENRFTQENVAIKIGVTTKTYRTWEKDIEKMKSGIKSIGSYPTSTIILIASPLTSIYLYPNNSLL